MADKKSVVIVDDDDFVRTMVTKLVSSFGYATYTAHNGLEALDLLGKIPAPDVVITDIIMPRKGGLETVREIREKYPLIKIVAVSGGGRSEQGDYLELARKFGANEIVSKPIDPVHLKAILKRLTEHSMEQQRPFADDDAERTPPPFDFAALRDFAYDETELQGVAELFITESIKTLDLLRMSCTGGVNPTWVEAAHKLKGSAAMLRAGKLERLCDEAQRMHDASAQEREDLYKKICAANNEVGRALEKAVAGKR